jgi:hypothetical protein
MRWSFHLCHTNRPPAAAQAWHCSLYLAASRFLRLNLRAQHRFVSTATVSCSLTKFRPFHRDGRMRCQTTYLGYSRSQRLDGVCVSVCWCVMVHATDKEMVALECRPHTIGRRRQAYGGWSVQHGETFGHRHTHPGEVGLVSR